MTDGPPPSKRSPEQLEYHAAKEREYRVRKRDARDAAVLRLGIAADELRERHGYSVGQLVDLILGSTR